MKNKKRYNSKKPSNHLPLLIGVLVFVILIGGGLLAWKIHTSNRTSAANVKLTQSTQLEKKIGEQAANEKGATPATSSTTTTPTTDSTSKSTATGASNNAAVVSTGAAVTPTISYPTTSSSEPSVSKAEVDAFIPGIEESGGTCTLTLTGPANITKTDIAVLNGQTTRCPNFYPSAADGIVAGNWTAVVSYSSANYHGTSAPVSFTIE